MRRALVLTSDGCRHPFRRSLPPVVLRAAGAGTGRAPSGSDADWKLFLLSFGAFFVAFYTYLG